MDLIIDRRSFILMAAAAALLPDFAFAETPEASAEADVFGPIPSSEVVEADLHYRRRPVIVFADSPNDPNFIRQMEILPRVYDDFIRRDVILITDTDPQARNPLRLRLRPRGFSLVIMDKDWRSATRKPLPWEGREIVNAIDRMPIARTESLERNPSGR